VELLGDGGTYMGEGIRVACELRPHPDLVVVLIDGFTPWPAEPPTALRVVVGLLHARGAPPPRWARAVLIAEDAA
jgi:hypothetical protein